jgi:flagellar hook-associated protein 2
VVDSINLNSLRVDDSGRVSVSGLGSGIDYQAAVDAIIKARQIPIDRLSTRITGNEDKITAYQDARNLLNGLQDSLKNLRGAVSVDNSTNAFAAKQAFASVSRTDGATASPAANLLGVSLTNTAAAGTHTLEVLQTAASHKISSDAYTSTTSVLGFADGDQFTIEGKVITLSATDTLLSVRDRINAANTGTSPSGVSASIVSVSPTQNYLVLTKDTAGTSISLSETTNTPLATMGILTAGGAVKNELQAARKAQFYADGLLDQTNKKYESARLSSAAATLGSNGTIHFDDGVTTLDLAYTSGQSVQTLADNINADATLQGMGISASVVSEGGQVRLKIESSGNAFTMTETGGGSALTALGVSNARLLIERDTNTINDLFGGMTLTLFQAEVGTSVSIDVEQDLASVKTQISAFVDAYNALKEFINKQTYTDPTTNKPGEDATLISSRTIAEIEQDLNGILGSGTDGVSDAFSVLAQIGVGFVDNSTLSDPLQADTLTIDESKLDATLLSNIEDVRRLFAFDFSASDPRIALLGYSSKTSFDASGYTLNIGPVGSSQETSAAVTDSAAFLNDAANSVGATTSGQFTINGTAITYDITTDSLDSLATKITGAGISGITASVVTDANGNKQLRIDAASGLITIAGDTGDLLTKIGFTSTATRVVSANINGPADGSDNGSVTVSGTTLTATSATGAEGLQLFYSGSAQASGISLDYTVGVGTKMFYAVDSMLDPVDGSVENEISALTDQNTTTQTRVDEMMARLDRQRQALLDRFIAMETALTSMKNLLDSLKQTFEAMSNQNNN